VLDCTGGDAPASKILNDNGLAQEGHV
jgi:hypothetical protein